MEPAAGCFKEPKGPVPSLYRAALPGVCRAETELPSLLLKISPGQCGGKPLAPAEIQGPLSHWLLQLQLLEQRRISAIFTKECLNCWMVTEGLYYQKETLHQGQRAATLRKHKESRRKLNKMKKH
ncbi:hypothetical protein CapIbe_000695 [Capra ibex]